MIYSPCLTAIDNQTQNPADFQWKEILESKYNNLNSAN